jgi:hypothetical protein
MRVASRSGTIAAMTATHNRQGKWLAVGASAVGMVMLTPVLLLWMGVVAMGTDSCPSPGQLRGRPICSIDVLTVIMVIPVAGVVLGIVTTLVGGGVAIHRGRRVAWWIAGPWLLVVLSGLVSLIAAETAT